MERLSLLDGLRETADMIRWQHTVFALPFAVIALITAAGAGWPGLREWLLVLAAMVTARTAAMAFNRLADHRLDAANPRTASRALPAGRLGRGFVWSVVALSAAGFLAAAAALNPVCLALAPPTLAILLGYSYAKRFTATAHLWLGLALGLAPIGAWVAVTASVETPALVLAAAVLTWVAGFDVIYSLQDEDHDRAAGLHSLPARLGARGALAAARLLHVTAFAAFAAFGMLAGGGTLRWAATLAAGALLVWQHRMVGPGRLDRVDAAFFTANGVLSLAMCGLYLSAKIAGL